MKNKIVLLIIILLYLDTNIFSQNFTQTIRGKVLDDETEQPLPGATVLIKDLESVKGTITNVDGEFQIDNIPVGRHNLTVSFIGYNDIIINNLLLTSSKELVLELKMQEKVTNLKTITVKATSQKEDAVNDMALISARSFTVEETERFAGSLGDPSRMVMNYAGVNSAGDTRNDIVIRGNSPSGLLWRLEGIEIPNPNHFGALGTTGGPVSILNNNLLTNSDFYTGAFPAEFGNALSGVFDLNMRNGNNHNHEYTGQVGFNGFELGAEGPFSKNKRSSYLINYRYSTLSVLNKVGFRITGDAIPQYQDVSFKLNFPMNKGRFSIFGLGGPSYIDMQHDTSSENSYNLVGSDVTFRSGMFAVGSSLVQYLDTNLRLQVNLSAQGSENIASLDSVKNEIPYPYYRSNLRENKYELSSSLKKKFNAKNNLQTGFIVSFYHNNLVDSMKIQDTLAFHDITNTNGDFFLIQAYTQFKHRFTNTLTVIGGIHYQQLTMNNSFAVEPRIAAQWQFNGDQMLNAGFGMHSILQPHTIYFIRTYLPDGSEEETNSELDFTRSNQWILGYKYNFSENLYLKMETYYQYLHDIPVRITEDAVFSMVNAGADFYMPMVDSLENKGKGYNYGLDITLENFLHNGYYFLVTTSLFESKYKNPDNILRNTAFNGNFVFNALTGYEFKIKKYNLLNINIKGVYAGGKRYIPILLDRSITAKQTVYDYNKAFDVQYPNYLRFDVRVGFKQNLKKITQEWAIDLQNITNHKNIFRQQFNAATGKLETDYQMSFFPMFLYRITF